MEANDVNSAALIKALRNIFGEMMASKLIQHLEDERVIHDGAIDIDRLEPALKDLFSQGAGPLLRSLLIVQQKSVTKALR